MQSYKSIQDLTERARKYAQRYKKKKSFNNLPVIKERPMSVQNNRPTTAKSNRLMISQSADKKFFLSTNYAHRTN